MKIIEKIYSQLPVWTQNCLCSFSGWLVSRRRYDAHFHALLNLFEAGQISQAEELSSFLQSIASMPYYNQLFQKCGVDVKATDIYAEIQKCPILSKNFVKEHLSSFINSEYNGKFFYNHTSGTTGSGMIFPYSEDMEHRQWAVWWRYRRRLGIQFNTWCGWFGGRRIIWGNKKNDPCYRINYPAHQIMFSAHHLSSQTVHLYYQTILNKKLTWLHGYPSQISFFVSLCRERMFPPIEHVKFITFGAENLLEHQKNAIQNFFPCARLAQHYGLSEGVANISEMPDGTLVTDDDFCFVEFIPVSDKDPSLCHIIGTGFSNRVFPLLRYDTGDLARVSRTDDGKIKILEIDGRNEDYITLKDGNKLGRLDHLLKDFPEIREAQIYQPSLEKIVFRIVKNGTYTEKTQIRLEAILADWFSGKINWEIRYYDSISKTSSNKLKFVISEVK